MPFSLPLTAALLSAATFQPRIDEQQLHPQTQAPRLVSGVLSTALTGDLPEAARAWAWGERWRFGVPGHSSLVNGNSFNTRFGASFHLLQVIGDVEVYGAKLVVTVNARAEVVQVASSVVTTPTVEARWNTSSEEALRLAAAEIPFAMLDHDGRPYGASKRYFFETRGALHAGWLVHVASADRTKNWYVLVDAVDGTVLATQNRMHYQSSQAKAYPVSPGGLDAGVGRTPTQTVQLRHADGGSMVVPWEGFDGGPDNDGGFLNGTQLTAYNCCPTDNCLADGGQSKVAGTFMYSSFTINYDTAVCRRVQRASNNPAIEGAGAVVGDAGTFEYTPVDPPVNTARVVLTDPTNSDQFAEVHAFYHVNRVYDWVRGLSTKALATFTQQPAIRPFTMRDERLGKKPAVWANMMFPDVQTEISRIDGGLTALIGCVTTPGCRVQINNLTRWDNAAFSPKENFAQIPLPGFDTGVDTLLIFQGTAADAAYDATVLQHEFGHGVVYATAELSFDSLALDQHSANNEGGALHEGFADYVAAAFNNEAAVGPYFGPRALATAGLTGIRQESYLRTMTNSFSCPDVLWGEVHQDSQHVAAALWAGRQAFQGTDNGATYDAAFYAMLVSISPTADFAQAAAAMVNRVAEAFPANTSARTQMQGFFTTRGVTGCNKIMNAPLPLPRSMYAIAAPPSSLRNQLVPGPIQFKLAAPNGARRIRFTGTLGSSGGSIIGGGSAPTVTALASAAPIIFSVDGGAVNNTATKTGVVSNNTALNPLDVDFPCGANNNVYVTLGVTSGGASLTGLQINLDPLVSCTPDAGTQDAGMTGTDGGSGNTETKTVNFAGEPAALSPAAKEGCGCSAAEGALPALGLALATLLRRRRSRTTR